MRFKSTNTQEQIIIGKKDLEQVTKQNSLMEIKDDSTMIVGLKTTMECIGATDVTSVQFIYITKDSDICNKLIPLEKEENLYPLAKEPEMVPCTDDYAARIAGYSMTNEELAE